MNDNPALAAAAAATEVVPAFVLDEHILRSDYACANRVHFLVDALADLSERHLQGWPTKQADDPMQLAASRERAIARGAKD